MVSHALILRRARKAPSAPDLSLLGRVQPLRVVEAASFAVALGAGLLLMQLLGYRLGYPQWLSAKLGLVAFLLVPLEGFRVYLSVAWLAPGLRASSTAEISRDLERALSMEEMLQALAVPLLLLGLPVILWLSFSRPF